MRDKDALKEVVRILGLRQEAFPSAAAWGFSVLGAAARTSAAAQHGFRLLMKRLHPDKLEQTPQVARAVELVREARDAVERSLLRLRPPAAPRNLRAAPVCLDPGKRRLRLRWAAPEEQPNAPVARYVVAVVDPAYGRALTVAQLQPDYNQELQRFQDVGELTSYILAEEDLQKMPRLWQQRRVTIQVAAGNEAGQGPWAILEAPLMGSAAAR